MALWPSLSLIGARDLLMHQVRRTAERAGAAAIPPEPGRVKEVHPQEGCVGKTVLQFRFRVGAGKSEPHDPNGTGRSRIRRPLRGTREPVRDQPTRSSGVSGRCLW
jgi:hypothetical protein